MIVGKLGSGSKPQKGMGRKIWVNPSFPFREGIPGCPLLTLSPCSVQGLPVFQGSSALPPSALILTLQPLASSITGASSHLTPVSTQLSQRIHPQIIPSSYRCLHGFLLGTPAKAKCPLRQDCLLKPPLDLESQDSQQQDPPPFRLLLAPIVILCLALPQASVSSPPGKAFLAGCPPPQLSSSVLRLCSFPSKH